MKKALLTAGAVGVLAIGATLVFGATTTITVNSRNINGDFFSPSTVIPTAQNVTVQAVMSDATYHDTSKSFTMTFQYSLDGGSTWIDDLSCSWRGRLGDSTAPNGVVNYRPACGTNVSNLAGQRGRLHINTASLINMGATINFK
jgi:hypothetical protein